MKVKGLNNLVADLIGKGIDPNQAGNLATQIFKTQAAQNAGGIGAAGITAAAAGGAGTYSIGKDILANIVAGNMGGIGSFLTQGANTGPASGPGGKGFIYGPQNQMEYTRYYNSPYATISRILGGGQNTPTPDDYRRSQVESVKEQAEDMTRRKVQEYLATVAPVEALKATAGLEGTRLQQEGALGVQELKSLGDVQKQRVQSGYEAASGMLQKAIENIAYVEKLGQSDTRKQLAALPTI